MVRALAVSDEQIAALPGGAGSLGVDLVIAAGDLPYVYLAELADRTDRPGVFVPGNHDPDLSGYAQRAGLWLRYNDGANQWTQRQQARRARRLVRAAHRRTRRDGRRVDVLLTHAPPRGCGDREDGPHHGFECLHRVVAALAPRLLVHGHIHPYGEQVPDRFLGDTRVVNVVGRKILEL